MTQEEAINARELLLVEQRKIRQAVRILKSESIIPCAGVSMAIGQYNRRLQQIDDDIREIAEQYSLSLQEEGNACAVEFQMAEEATAAGSTPSAPAAETAPAVETSSTPVAETTVSVAEAVARPAASAQPGIPSLSQFTEQQIADAIVQLTRIWVSNSRGMKVA